MENNSANEKHSLRRHHLRRLKKKRSLYWGTKTVGDSRLIGLCSKTSCICSCWNQRKYHGLSFQELKALNKFTQEKKHIDYGII
jgi:hypothetical protein